MEWSIISATVFWCLAIRLVATITASTSFSPFFSKNLQMIFDFTAKVLFSYESEKSGENIAESFTNFLLGLMSIPLNIPGTAFHRCLKNQKRAIKSIAARRGTAPSRDPRRRFSWSNCGRHAKGKFLDRWVCHLHDVWAAPCQLWDYILHTCFSH